MDVRKALGRASAALAGVAPVAASIGGANFWNPVGWGAPGIGGVTLGLSRLFEDRETKLQHRKASATEQLREAISATGSEAASHVTEWFEKDIRDGLACGMTKEDRLLHEGMSGLARKLEESADKCRSEVSTLNRRLLVRQLLVASRQNRASTSCGCQQDC